MKDVLGKESENINPIPNINKYNLSKGKRNIAIFHNYVSYHLMVN